MKLPDAIKLIQHHSITEAENARWADLGCGSGLFTFALANLLKRGGLVYAVDKSPVSLQKLFNPNKIPVETLQLDFTKQPLPFDTLNGILMANSLHYVADKMAFIETATRHLATNGFFLIVEYDTVKPNQWVPYPANPALLKQVFAKAGCTNFIKLNEMPSLYNSGKMYSAIIS